MFDTMHGRIVPLHPRPKPTPKPAVADPAVLKQHCLHPAEAWVLRRRAHRPQPAPRRLPQVARTG